MSRAVTMTPCSSSSGNRRVVAVGGRTACEARVVLRASAGWLLPSAAGWAGRLAARNRVA